MNYIYVILVLIWFFITPQYIYANIGVSPGVIEIISEPGKKGTGYLYIKNQGSNKQVIVLSIEDWWKKETGLDAPQNKDWLKITPNPDKILKIGPNKIKKIKINTFLDKDFLGETMAMLFIAGSDSKAVSSKNLSIRTRQGVAIYAIAKGTERIENEIISIKSNFVNTSSGPTVGFTLVIKNTGNVHVRPTGKIIIYSNNKQIGEAQIQSGWPVFPNRKQEFNAVLNIYSLESGIYSGKVIIDYGSMYNKELFLEKSFNFRINQDQTIDIL